MAPERRVPGEISVNARVRGHELSPEERSKVFGRALAGQKAADIARAEQLPTSTVHDTIKKAPQRTQNKSARRVGRPKK